MNEHVTAPDESEPLDLTSSDELLRLLHRHHGNRKHPDIDPLLLRTRYGKVNTLVVQAPARKVPALIAALLAPEPKHEPDPPVIEPEMPDPPRRIFISAIRDATLAYFGITYNEFISESRRSVLVRPRHIAFYLAKELTPRSMPDIGRRLGGGWDHSTILNGIRRIKDRLPHEEKLRADVEAVRKLAIAADPMLAGGGE